jgi:hypothetical protein
MEIEFSLLENYLHIEHKPLPAGKFSPSWFKTLPPTTNTGLSTLKRCPPMTDMFGLGYIMPMWAEFKLIPTAQGTYHVHSRMPTIENPFEGSRNSMQYQFPQQYKDTPWEDYQVIKVTSPWVVKTPPGYSLLILPLFGQHGTALEPIPAVIDADQYHVSLGITCRVKYNPDVDLSLLPGDPFVQLIPFKRDEWTAKYSIKKLIDHAKVANKLRTYISSGYRRFWHKAKVFK